jgi:hypothetical protein
LFWLNLYKVKIIYLFPEVSVEIVSELVGLDRELREEIVNLIQICDAINVANEVIFHAIVLKMTHIVDGEEGIYNSLIHIV